MLIYFSDNTDDTLGIICLWMLPGQPIPSFWHDVASDNMPTTVSAIPPLFILFNCNY